MADEPEGLIERAASFLAHPTASRRGGAAADELRPGGGAGATRGRAFDAFGSDRRLAEAETGGPPVPAPIVDEEEVRLRPLLRAAWLHKFALFGSSLLLMAVATAAILAMTPQYSATAVVAIGNHAPSIATRIESDVDGNVVLPLPDVAAVHTQVDYLSSRPVAKGAMDALGLWHEPEFDPSLSKRSGLFAKIGDWIGSATGSVHKLRALLSGHDPAPNTEASDLVRRRQALDIFMSKLKVAAKPESDIITVQFEDPDPQLAAAAANAVVDHYLGRQIDVAATSAQQATQGLEKAVAGLRQRVAQSDRAFEQYRGSFEAQNGRELLDKETLEATAGLAAAKNAREVIEARLKALESLRGKDPHTEATSEIVDSRVMQALQEEAAALQGRLAERSAILGEANPQVQEVRASIARVQGEMRAEVARQVAAAEADLKVAVAKEGALRQSLAANRTQSAQASGGQAKLDALKAEAESNRAVLSAFLTRLHEADTSARLLPHANAEIVEHAGVPRVPSSPNTRLLLGLALIGSTVTGFGVAVALERAAPTFRSSQEIEAETGVRTLGLVPLIDDAASPLEAVLATAAPFYGEAIRTLYMTLLLRQSVNVLVVTSARPGDGKTTLAASMALVAAKAGRKVLLIDADLCTGGASRIFGLSGQEGLAELIAGRRRVPEVLATNPNFAFIAAGAPDNVLAARAGLEGIGDLLRGMRREYDLIIIDSPPVLAVADAMAIAAPADAVLFAVRWGGTPRQAAKLGLKRLHVSAPGAAIGAVLTMVDAREHSRFGYADSTFYASDLIGYHRSHQDRAQRPG